MQFEVCLTHGIDILSNDLLEFPESNFFHQKSSHQMTCPKFNPHLNFFGGIFFDEHVYPPPKCCFLFEKNFKEIWTGQVIYGYLILFWLFDRQLGESAQDLCDSLGPLAREVD